MSRNKKLKPAAPAPGGDDSQALAGLATAALAAGRHKDAIEGFKDLLKREPRADWRDGLAAAYAGRAGQLADKGMFKEALALWRVRAEACAVPVVDGPYVGWLLKSGQTAQALGLLGRMPPAEQTAAQSRFAAAVLVAPDALLTGLPADLPLMQHLGTARAALAACAQGDSAALASALQAISFHSPYRDLRPLLKALALQATDPAQAAATLARVPAQGPFEPLAQALRVCLMPGTGWLAGLQSLDDAGRSLVLDLKGCPAVQRPLLLGLMERATAASVTPLEMFDLVLRHRAATGLDWAARVCRRLLPHVPQRLEVFCQTFAAASPAEQARLMALAAELRMDPDEAETRWLRFVRLSSAAAAPGSALSAALVLRHLADQHRGHSADGQLCSHARDWLTDSLTLDPTDRASHLNLLQDAQRRGDLKQARALLDAARQQFPDEPQFLLLAVETALASGAFKKAAGLAKQLLQIDPLNPKVGRLIGQAHLSHARKQLHARNPQAALREIDEAANWLRDGADLGMVKLLRCFAVAPGDSVAALPPDMVVDFGSPLLAGFHLLREGHRGARKPAGLLRSAGLSLEMTPATADLQALARALNSVAPREAALRSALQTLLPVLERAARTLSLGEGETVLVCEALLRQEQFNLTMRFAHAALRQWPGRPVFEYLHAAGRFGAEPLDMPESEWQRLDEVCDRAEAAGDQRTATRLRKLLREATHFSAGPAWLDDMGPADMERADELAKLSDMDFMDQVGDLDPDDLRQLLTMMLAAGGQAMVLELARRNLDPAVFDQIRRATPGGDRKFAQALIDLLPTGGQPSTLPSRAKPPAVLPAKRVPRAD